ncbi:hypothetical protein AB4225_36115 [Streptomyces sp. 2RAF24]|uniref:hypothetical protein n=1 Tax=Streptomyces sp. 2RAF24 TaxID=3232997 RepID=UPI003F9D267B
MSSSRGPPPRSFPRVCRPPTTGTCGGTPTRPAVSRDVLEIVLAVAPPKPQLDPEEWQNTLPRWHVGANALVRDLDEAARHAADAVHIATDTDSARNLTAAFAAQSALTTRRQDF